MAPPARAPFAAWLAGGNDITAAFLAAAGRPGMINLAGGLPDPALFPVEELAALAAAAVRERPAEVLGYGPVAGLPALRDALASRLSGPALRLGRDNLLVVSGGLQALDLIGKVLLEEGATVAAQWPTYLGALDAWRPRRPRYRPLMPGATATELAAACTGAAFAYAVPNFSNPTGRLVPGGERHALVAAARAAGTWLVEDDPYGSLGYGGPLPPRLIELAAADRPGAVYDGTVVYLGTLSKEVVPGLRVGWVAAAPDMIAALARARQGADMCGSGLTQAVALGALAAGLPERLAAAAVAHYRGRRDALLAAMDAELAGRFAWEVPEGGMFVWARARDQGLDTDRLFDAALAAGVCITPGSVFDPAGRDRGAIRLNFTLNPPDRLAEGVRRLAAAVAATG
ncbi:MAG: PLP-dependent aminotransferase family protein [Rhodobacteraceae bacterium]|jgi:2-aminoadipate transaminase|nr:PLP-dependent aminotransferase family protein [Paracoccaceae bacterium]